MLTFKYWVFKKEAAANFLVFQNTFVVVLLGHPLSIKTAPGQHYRDNRQFSYSLSTVCSVLAISK